MGGQKKAKAASKWAARAAGSATAAAAASDTATAYDLHAAFGVAVGLMQDGNVEEAGAAFASTFMQANKLMGELLHDGEETDAVSALQHVMFDSLVFRAACLNACQNHPARCEARANLTTAVELAYQMGDPERVGKVLELLAASEAMTKRFNMCLQVAKKMEQMANQPDISLSQPKLLGTALTYKGVALSGLGQHVEAVQVLEEAQSQAEQAGDTVSQTVVSFQLTRALVGSVDHAKARATATQGLELAETTADDDCIAGALECMGAVCLAEGEAEKAADYFDRAMHQGTEGESLRIGDGGALIQLAHAFIQLGDWEAAERQLAIGIQVAQQHQDEALGAQVVYTMACWHGCKGEVAEEQDCLQKVADKAAALNDALLELQALISLNNLAVREGKGEAGALRKLQEREATLFPKGDAATVESQAPVEEGEGGRAYVMPCCRARAAASQHEPLLRTGACPACGAHVCGRRHPGIAACAACTAP